MKKGKEVSASEGSEEMNGRNFPLTSVLLSCNPGMEFMAYRASGGSIGEGVKSGRADSTGFFFVGGF